MVSLYMFYNIDYEAIKTEALSYILWTAIADDGILMPDIPSNHQSPWFVGGSVCWSCSAF